MGKPTKSKQLSRAEKNPRFVSSSSISKIKVFMFSLKFSMIFYFDLQVRAFDVLKYIFDLQISQKMCAFPEATFFSHLFTIFEIHSSKQDSWTYLRLPVHLQGDIIILLFYEPKSDSKQILHQSLLSFINLWRVASTLIISSLSIFESSFILIDYYNGRILLIQSQQNLSPIPFLQSKFRSFLSLTYYKQMSTISKNHHSAVEDFQSDFCPKCGALIDLDTLLQQITCPACKKKLSFKQFVGKPIKSHMVIQKDRDWVRKYVHTETAKERRGKTKMTIKEPCPICKHPELKYYTMQTRSADEGSTVFYECEKCLHSFSVNN